MAFKRYQAIPRPVETASLCCPRRCSAADLEHVGFSELDQMRCSPTCALRESPERDKTPQLCPPVSFTAILLGTGRRGGKETKQKEAGEKLSSLITKALSASAVFYMIKH